MTRTVAATCLNCKRFEHAPERIEAAFPGLSSLSSAYAAVRCDDGICSLHDRYVSAGSSCPQFR